MMNSLGKLLVFFHTLLSVAAMIYAVYTVTRGRDLGWREPAKEVTEYSSDGKATKVVRHASIIDKSLAAAKAAHESRDRTYAEVLPAIERVRKAEPYLPTNHLHYLAEIQRLRTGGKIEVKRLKAAGMVVDPEPLGKPVYDDNAVDAIKKSNNEYETDLIAVYKEVDGVESEVRDIVQKTRKFTAELTGTDENNMYVQPGLYQLIELEFKAQTQLRTEIEDIKPNWSKAIEQSRLYGYRRADLEATLQKLKGPMPKEQKKL